MRYRLMATYRGVPYEAGIGPQDGDVVLFAACPPPEELGFEPATGHWRKHLRRQDVQALWESKPTGKFRGEGCLVLDDLGDRLHIAYLGHDAQQAEQLGYWEVDRGVFEMMTPREEVTEIIEERVDYLDRLAARPTAAANGRAGPRLAGDPGVPDVPRGFGMPRGFGAPGTAADERPLPLEEAARLAASARLEASARLTSPLTDPGLGLPDGVPGRADRWPPLPSEPLERAAAWDYQWDTRQDSPGRPPRQPAPRPGDVPDDDAPSQPDSRRSRHDSARRSLATRQTFTELADLAAIPTSAFAVGEEVDGAMCLLRTADGFEVFNSADGARHEVRVFEDEESAYFYLFGILAAEAVRTGRLAPRD